MDSADTMHRRFASLFSHLTAMQRKAERERERESVAARVEREKTLFLRDRRAAVTKSSVAVLLERIEELVDTSTEGDALLTNIRRIREDYGLDRDLNERIGEEAELMSRLETLRYSEVHASQPEARN